MPSQYFLFVNSRPKPGSGVDDDLWTKWYIDEHVSTRYLTYWAFLSLFLGQDAMLIADFLFDLYSCPTW